LGSTIIDNAVDGTNDILGLHNHRSPTAANCNLVVGCNTKTYYLNGSNQWTAGATGLHATNKYRFITYLDRVGVMDGATFKSSADCITWVNNNATLNDANWPTSKFATILNTRVVVAGDSSNPDTISLSSLVSAGAISWTSGNKTVQVSPNDGAGGITGLTGNGRVILIFKQRGMYRYDDNELQRIGYVGTPSHESICTDDQGITYFFGQGANGVGFYRTQGGFPEKISRAITRWVEAISASQYTNIACYTDSKKVEWTVGSITLDENTYTNVSLVYSISDRTWTVFSRADRFTVFSQYIDSSGNMTVVGGDTDSEVQTIDSGYSDNGTAIFSEVEMAPMVFSSRGATKYLRGDVIAMAEHFQGLELLIKVDNGRFVPVGSINKLNKKFELGGLNLRGNQFVAKLKSANSQEPWEFVGLEFPIGSIIDEGYI